MEIFDNLLMTLALGGLAVSGLLFASALLYPYLRSAWRQATILARAVFCGAVVVACLFGGAKGKISYPKTDTDVAYLVDAGSYVTNDAVHVAFTRVPTVPDTATFYLDYCALDGTNEQGVATNWVNAKTATFADLTVPFDFAFAAATNYNWMAYTDWTPGPAVQTNGVWHAYWGLDRKQGRYFIPVRTCVRDGSSVIATPKSKWDAKDPMELTEAEAYERYAPDTAILVDLSLANTNLFEVGIRRPRSGEATVDWGDGTTSEVSEMHSYDIYTVSHTYAKQGRYVIRVSDTVFVPIYYYVGAATRAKALVRVLRLGDHINFNEYGSSFIGDFYMSAPNLRAFPEGTLARWPKNTKTISSFYRNCPNLDATILPEWPEGVTAIMNTYANDTKITATAIPEWPKSLKTLCGAYNRCSGIRLSRIPDWPDGLVTISSQEGCALYDSVQFTPEAQIPAWPTSLTQANSTFQNCTSLAATNVPAWPTTLTSANSTFQNCTSLAATNVPAWPTTLTSANSTFQNCTSLAATNVPAWPTTLTSANSTFYNCSALAATSLPDWPTTLTSANSTFQNCTSLAATNVPDWSVCTALTQAERTYQNCKKLTGEVPAWPPNLTRAGSTFEQCAGLTGKIKAWPSTLTQAWWTFYNCKNLTGSWTSDPAELMPTNITSHDNCVGGASDALRALFYSDWGGTRAKTE